MRLLPATSLLCVIDVQERLLAVIPEAEQLVARVARLAEAAKILGVRRLLTEQYPKGLGATAPRLRPLLPPAEEKLSFSCAGCPGFDAAAAAGSGRGGGVLLSSPPSFTLAKAKEYRSRG